MENKVFRWAKIHLLVDIDWDTWAMKKNKPWLIAVFLGIDCTTPFIWGLEQTMKLGSRYETTRIQWKVGGCLFVAHMNPMGYSNDGPGLVASPVGWGPSTWCSKFFYHVTPWGIGSFFFGDSGKIDKSGSFRKMHILDVLVLLFFFFQQFYSVFLSGFIRNNWKFHTFFVWFCLRWVKKHHWYASVFVN